MQVLPLVLAIYVGLSMHFGFGDSDRTLIGLLALAVGYNSVISWVLISVFPDKGK